MFKEKFIVTLGEVKGLLHEDRDFLKQLVREAKLETLEMEIKTITEELCGHEFSASAVSSVIKRLQESTFYGKEKIYDDRRGRAGSGEADPTAEAQK
jgi:hypothetical protein